MFVRRRFEDFEIFLRLLRQLLCSSKKFHPVQKNKAAVIHDQTSSAKTYKCSSAAAYTQKYNCGV